MPRVERGVDGVVCGHIHTAEIRQIGDVTYYNDGDWVESCTALVEHPDGRMEIIDWAEHKRLGQAATTPATAAQRTRDRVKIASPRTPGIRRSMASSARSARPSTSFAAAATRSR